jgi:AcrR family transcriptional regulator
LDNKEKIIATAEKLFLKFGVKNVTVDDIAKEMTMSKKTIYTYFSKKEALIDKVVFTIFNRVAARIYDVIASNLDPILEIMTIESELAIYIDQQTSAMMYQLQKYYPKLYRKLTKKQSEVIDTTFRKNLERGVKLHLYREDINVDIITKIYYSTIISLHNQEVFPEEMYACCDLKHEYLIYHLRGIASDKGLKLITKHIKENKL